MKNKTKIWLELIALSCCMSAIAIFTVGLLLYPKIQIQVYEPISLVKWAEIFIGIFTLIYLVIKIRGNIKAYSIEK